MATKTTNYGLTKPAETDFYNIGAFNENADIIDAALASIDKLQAQITGLGIESGTWTPSGSTTYGYNFTETGTYVVCNNIVTASFYLEYTAAAVVADILISGLPYAAAADASGGGTMSIPSLPSGYAPNGFQVVSGEKILRPKLMSSSGAIVSVTSSGSLQRFIFSGSISYPK